MEAVDGRIEMPESSYNWSQHIEHVAISDVGRRRANNQDSVRVVLANDWDSWREMGHLFIVADGMGAHAAGEFASKMAVCGIGHAYHKFKDLSPPEALRKAVSDTNEEIHQRGLANVEFHNMGTTCSCLLMLPQGALVAHVGDSRVYRWRKNRLEQLTFDHSLQWEMRAAGSFKNSEMMASIPKNVITRSLGPKPQVEVDLEGPFPLQTGDVFLLCSDGLTGPVEDVEIAALLQHLPLQDAANMMVDLANLRGGPDNISLIVVRVVNDELTRLVDQSSPLVVGQQQTPERLVHPILWVVLGVGVLLFPLLYEQYFGLALASILCAAIALVAAVLQKYGGPDGAIRLGRGQRLGKGPHRSADGMSLKGLAQHVSQIMADCYRNWMTEGRPLSQLELGPVFQEAEALLGRQEYAQALDRYAELAHRLSESLRSQVDGQPDLPTQRIVFGSDAGR